MKTPKEYAEYVAATEDAVLISTFNHANLYQEVWQARKFNSYCTWFKDNTGICPSVIEYKYK